MSARRVYLTREERDLLARLLGGYLVGLDDSQREFGPDPSYEHDKEQGQRLLAKMER